MQQRLQAFVDELKTMPVAIQTQEANEQHYEVALSGSVTVAFWLLIALHQVQLLAD